MTGKMSRGAKAHFQPARISRAGKSGWLTEDIGTELLEEIRASMGEWELEVGFGKGKYLLDRAEQDPKQRLMGIELVSQYFRLASDRAQSRGLGQLVLMQGEALFLLATWLPKRFAHTIHVYFPDPWPKAKHHRRRLFDEETVDLLLGALAPGGKVLFATDHVKYGERVLEVLRGHPKLDLEMFDEVWPGGARTNYEAKYIVEGRPILRLCARPIRGSIPGKDAAEEDTPVSLDLVHPRGRQGLLVGCPCQEPASPEMASSARRPQE